MAKYAVDGTDDGTAAKTILGITVGGGRKFKIHEFVIGSSVTPVDQSANYQMNRTTVAGTGGTALTPRPLDPDDVAADATCQEAPTAEPTKTADEVLYSVSVNNRASYRWVANPGFELVSPTTTANGIALLVSSTSTAFAFESTILFEE